MKKFFKALIIVIILAAVGFGGYYYYYNRKMSKVTFHEADRILQSLQAGNKRFVAGKPRQHDYEKQILNTKSGQQPEAIILSCIDSRSIPELAFDQSIGEILTIRVAGNVINTDILGSMEFGTKIAGAKLILVLGHTHCGAVQAACHGDKFGNLTDVIEQIQPAVKTTEAVLQKSNCSDISLLNAIAKQNVINMVKQIPQKSPLIAELVKSGKIKIVGAMYDVSTGEVSFLNNATTSSSKV